MSGPILVVGGDGLIGRALCQQFEADGQDVIATSRRLDARSGWRLHLDLGKPGEWRLPESCRAAVLCAAATNLAFCRDHPDEARRINVDHTLKLARELSARSAFLVFLSTNQVFNGETPKAPPETAFDPRTVYGALKAEAEREFAKLGVDNAILRLSKVFSPDMPLLKEWREILRGGGSVSAFTDYRCAPIDLATTVQVISDVTAGERRGVWQLSPAEDVSYAEIAMEVARRVGADPKQALAIPSSEKTTLEHAPKHTTLDATRARLELGVDFPSLPAVLDRVWDS